MSIQAAVAELNKEIDRLQKIRDSLLSGAPAPASSSTKSASAPAKKRVLSAAARRKISQANKKRWAAIKKADAAKK